jgi:hypothetical protein
MPASVIAERLGGSAFGVASQACRGVILPGRPDVGAEGQYADREHLRPLAEAILVWAESAEGVAIQLRKGYVSLLSPRRKFAQVTAGTKSAVDVTFRWDGPTPGRLEPIRARSEDPFAWRIRLRSSEDVDDELFALLAAALKQNR